MHALVAWAFAMHVVIWSWRWAKWRAWELLALVVPFACYVLFTNFVRFHGTLSNVVIELGLVGVAMLPAAVLRVALRNTIPQWLLSGTLIALLSLLGIGLSLAMPPLPE